MALGWINCDGFFYYPSREVYGDPAAFGLVYESVEFASSDGLKLHGWFFPAAGAARGTVVHCHGNGGNLTGHFEFIRWLPGAGWNVLCFDYQGYGRSEGKPTREGTILDGHGAVDYVQGRADVDGDRIVVFGQSLGGAVGVVVAAEREDIRGIAVDSAFHSYRAMVKAVCRQVWYTWGLAGLISRYLISDVAEPVDVVAAISPRPIYIFHGTADTIVPPGMSEKLFEAAEEPKELYLADGVDHTATLEEIPAARDRLVAFFDRCVGSDPFAGQSRPHP